MTVNVYSLHVETRTLTSYIRLTDIDVLTSIGHLLKDATQILQF